MEHQGEVHIGADRVGAVLEGRDDAEVAAAASQRPQQVRVLVLARSYDLAGGGDNLGREQVVAGQAVGAAQPSDTAAKSQPGDSGFADQAERYGETDPLSGHVDIADRRTAGRPDAAPFGVHVHLPHTGQVDDQAVIHDRIS